MAVQGSTYAPTTAMPQLTLQINQLNAQQVQLEEQLTSGVVSSSYAGLGDQCFQALDLQPQITQVGAWQQNIAAAQGALSVTQTAMTQIGGIATALETSLTSLEGDTSPTTRSVVATQARSALVQLGSLLNTTNGSEYIFGGNAADVAPVTDPSALTSSAFFQQISASVSSLGTTGASAVEAATLATATSNSPATSPFSVPFSVSGVSATALVRSVTVGPQQHVPVGMVATQGSASTSGSTGSSIRDLMRALATVGSIDQTGSSAPGLSTLIADTSTAVGTISQSLILSVAALGQTQAQLTGQAAALSTMSDALTRQLGSIKDSDPAALSTQITTTQNQLTASYTMIADMKGLSLAAYI